MGLYDSFKDVLSVAQKADNIELYKQLLDYLSCAHVTIAFLWNPNIILLLRSLNNCLDLFFL